MSLFNFLKEKKKKAKVKKKAVSKAKEVKKKSQESSLKKVSGAEILVLRSPHITEKATDLSRENKYVFKVSRRANKNNIKRAVEGNYNVDVESVRIINVPRKKRKLGRQEGWRKGYKKAIVKVKKGQKIEILPR